MVASAALKIRVLCGDIGEIRVTYQGKLRSSFPKAEILA